MTGRGTLHLPVNTLGLRRGGLVKAVMLRANALAAADPGRDVVIEVLAFQPRLEEDVAELVERGFLDPRVHVRSILRCLDPSVVGPSPTDPIVGCFHHGIPLDDVREIGRPAAAAVRDPRAVVLGDPHAGIVQRLWPAKLRPRFSTHDDAGRRRHVDIFDRRGVLLRREEFGSGERVVRILDFRPGDKRPVAHRWIGRDGACFLAVWQEPGRRAWGTAYAAHDGFQAFAGPHDLYVGAFEHALRDEREPVLFSEFREALANAPGGIDQVVQATHHPSVRRVAVLHSKHALQGERSLPLRSSPKFSALLTDLGGWDMIVTATEQQKDDIAQQYGHGDRIVAIPHYAPEPQQPVDDADYDPNRFVLVARIHRKKRLDEAIEMFRLVADGNPRARLEIYGFGYGDELESRLRGLVADLGLTDNVLFQGFVEDVSSIYAGACASLQTSESEGFGMALLESLAAGVPVVAYDVTYGARETIRDDIDGYVVPWGDREAMAKRLLDLSGDPQLRARLAAAGPVGAARFSRDRYIQEWTAALAALPVRESEATVRAAQVVDGQFQLTADGTGVVVLRLRGHGEDLETPIEDGTARIRLPGLAEGEIVDVYVRSAGEERRAVFAGRGKSDDPTVLVYATAHGNLSLKRVRLGKHGAGSRRS